MLFSECMPWVVDWLFVSSIHHSKGCIEIEYVMDRREKSKGASDCVNDTGCCINLHPHMCNKPLYLFWFSLPLSFAYTHASTPRQAHHIAGGHDRMRARQQIGCSSLSFSLFIAVSCFVAMGPTKGAAGSSFYSSSSHLASSFLGVGSGASQAQASTPQTASQSGSGGISPALTPNLAAAAAKEQSLAYDQSLLELIKSMDEFSPIIPDELIDHFMMKSGLATQDPKM